MAQFNILTIKKGNINAQIQALKNEMTNEARDIFGDYLTGYISNNITEYADQAISVYSYDQIDFYNNHREECDEAAAELCILDGFDPRRDSIGDLIERAGAAGWFLANERAAYESIEELKRAYILRAANECGAEYLRECEAEALEDMADDLDNLDDLDNIGIYTINAGILTDSDTGDIDTPVLKYVATVDNAEGIAEELRAEFEAEAVRVLGAPRNGLKLAYVLIDSYGDIVAEI